MRIRRSHDGDLDDIAAIERAVFGDSAWTRDMLREELTASTRTYLVVTDAEERIHGYAGLFVAGIEGDVQTIAVAEEARGGGNGRALLDALLDEAKAQGVRDVFLEVRADNPVARGLYGSVGFEEIGTRPRYYQPDDVDAIVMKLEMRNRR